MMVIETFKTFFMWWEWNKERLTFQSTFLWSAFYFYKLISFSLSGRLTTTQIDLEILSKNRQKIKWTELKQKLVGVVLWYLYVFVGLFCWKELLVGGKIILLWILRRNKYSEWKTRLIARRRRVANSIHRVSFLFLFDILRKL